MTHRASKEELYFLDSLKSWPHFEITWGHRVCLPMGHKAGELDLDGLVSFQTGFNLLAWF